MRTKKPPPKGVSFFQKNPLFRKSPSSLSLYLRNEKDHLDEASFIHMLYIQSGCARAIPTPRDESRGDFHGPTKCLERSPSWGLSRAHEMPRTFTKLGTFMVNVWDPLGGSLSQGNFHHESPAPSSRKSKISTTKVQSLRRDSPKLSS